MLLFSLHDDADYSFAADDSSSSSSSSRVQHFRIDEQK